MQGTKQPAQICLDQFRVDTVWDAMSEDAFADTFDLLFAHQFGPTVRLAALFGADDPEDTAQEAFARLHHAWPALRNDAAALTYLRRTVTNLTRSRVRHLAVVRRNAPRPLEVEGADAPLLAAEQHDQLVRAVQALPDRQRKALVLHYWSNLNVLEIADILTVPPGTVKSDLHRARAAVGRRLGVDDA